MPWIVGIDEAGYGPNLGPFVMSSVACRAPADCETNDLWQLLSAAVRRPEENDDGRLVIGDSKQVYSPARGLAALEMSVLSVLAAAPTVNAFLQGLVAHRLSELREECWYTGASTLPAAIDPLLVAWAAHRMQAAAAPCGLTWGPIRCVVICTPRFNELTDRMGSKGGVLGHSLGMLLTANRKSCDGEEPLHFNVDKHGGRNNYAAMLQHAAGGGMVLAHEEGMERSHYRLVGLERDIRMTFEPRADGNHFCVALASMVSKYVRELLMREFNEFWRQHLPDVKPTAGYPGDSSRFFEDIRPALKRLGIAEAAVWRAR
jgi:hypothetical protein